MLSFLTKLKMTILGEDLHYNDARSLSNLTGQDDGASKFSKFKVLLNCEGVS